MARPKHPGDSPQVAEIAARFRTLAEPILSDLGLELVDAEFRREAHGWVLRLYMDRAGGVTLDDCQRVSEELGDHLDVEDFVGYPSPTSGLRLGRFAVGQEASGSTRFA